MLCIPLWLSIWIFHLKSGAEELRLVGGRTRCEGRVEVKYQGQWGTVCDDGWGTAETAVVCRQLGCRNSSGDSHSLQLSSFGAGSGMVWLDDVKCTGAESALWDCPHAPWGINDCIREEDVGLICDGEAEELRLVGGRTQCDGRVEVKHRGEWGTVCDDHWDTANFAVACRQLGCGNSSEDSHSLQRSAFGDGSGRIWLDDVVCIGDESALWECPHRVWGLSNCGHNEDVGVICDGSLSDEDIEVTPYVTRSGSCRIILLCAVDKSGVMISWHDSNGSEIMTYDGILHVTATNLNVSFTCIAQNPARTVNRTVIPREYCSEERGDPVPFLLYGFIGAKLFASLVIGFFLCIRLFVLRKKQRHDRSINDDRNRRPRGRQRKGDFKTSDPQKGL